MQGRPQVDFDRAFGIQALVGAHQKQLEEAAGRQQQVRDRSSELAHCAASPLDFESKRY